MPQRLPPLNALRAFEAAARHLSFSKAADELSVTPAAVSHQIKSLEDYLEVQLFRRLNKGLLLTDAGQAALPPMREGFERLAAAVELARSIDRRQVLTVSVAHSFAGKWLVPRLHRFNRAHPDIDVRLDANSNLADFDRDKVDVALRYGSGSYPGLHADCLLADEVVPVCSPTLLDGEHPLCEPADLRFHNLLHMDDSTSTGSWPNWEMWLLSAGVDINCIDALRGTRFTGSSMAIQAASSGHGVALVSRVLIADDVAEGRLVTPFVASMPVNFSYYLVCPQQAVGCRNVAAFRAWILQEAEATAAGRCPPGEVIA